MKKICSILSLVVLISISGCKTGSESKVTFVGGTSRWIFSNGIVNVVVQPARGVYDIIRTADQQKIVTGAYLRIDKDSTNEPPRKRGPRSRRDPRKSACLFFATHR